MSILEHNSAQYLIDTIDARWEKVVTRIDEIGHGAAEYVGEMFGAFLSFLGGAAVKGGSAAVQKMDSISLEKSSSPTVPSISQVKAMSTPERTPQISQDIVASAKQATMAMSTKQFAVQDVDHHNFSPSATPSIGFGAMSAGMSI